MTILPETAGQVSPAPLLDYHVTLRYVGQDPLKDASFPYARFEGAQCAVSVSSILLVRGELATARVEAMQIISQDPTPTAIQSENTYPHITVALAPGVRPKASNDAWEAYAINPGNPDYILFTYAQSKWLEGKLERKTSDSK
jgi:hypothetical protein